MYFNVIFVVHSLLCIGLIGLVLLQQGKGADAGATFGGSGNTVLGTGGADFLTRMTTSLAISFMVTSILLVRAYDAGPGVVRTEEYDPLKGSVVEELAEPVVAVTEPIEPEATSGPTAEEAAGAAAEDVAAVAGGETSSAAENTAVGEPVSDAASEAAEALSDAVTEEATTETSAGGADTADEAKAPVEKAPAEKAVE